MGPSIKQPPRPPDTPSPTVMDPAVQEARRRARRTTAARSGFQSTILGGAKATPSSSKQTLLGTAFMGGGVPSLGG